MAPHRRTRECGSSPLYACTALRSSAHSWHSSGAHRRQRIRGSDQVGRRTADHRKADAPRDRTARSRSATRHGVPSAPAWRYAGERRAWPVWTTIPPPARCPRPETERRSQATAFRPCPVPLDIDGVGDPLTQAPRSAKSRERLDAGGSNYSTEAEESRPGPRSAKPGGACCGQAGGSRRRSATCAGFA